MTIHEWVLYLVGALLGFGLGVVIGRRPARRPLAGLVARDRAIRLLQDYIGQVTLDFGDEREARVEVAAVVDAIIEAAQQRSS